MKTENKEDELLDDFLRAENLRNQRTVSANEIIALGKGSVRDKWSRRLQLFGPLAIAACVTLVFIFDFKEDAVQRSGGESLEETTLDLSEAGLLEDMMLLSPEINEFFAISEDSALEMLVMLEHKMK